MNPLAAQLRFPILLFDLSCVGSSAAWPLAGAQRRLPTYANLY
jgi:hypothetical protein